MVNITPAIHQYVSIVIVNVSCSKVQLPRATSMAVDC